MRRDDICLYLNPADLAELQALVTDRNTPRKLVWRAQIVLATADDLSRRKLKTARAFRMKEELRDIFAQADSKAEAAELLTAWLAWAKRSRLAPFRKLARTLGAHWDGILNGFESRLTNGGVEAINGLIQAAKARARGYRKARSLILIAYLTASNLSHLPASPYTTTSGGRPA